MDSGFARPKLRLRFTTGAWTRTRTAWFGTAVLVFGLAGLVGGSVPTSAFGATTGPTTPTVTGGSASWSSAASLTIGASGSVEQCRFRRCPSLVGYQYRTSTNGGAGWTSPVGGATVTMSAEGSTLVQFRAIDTAGNSSAWAPSSGGSGTVDLDRTPPTVPIVAGGSATPSVGAVSITASGATDPCTVNACSGVAGYRYRTSTDAGTTWSAPAAGSSVTISALGTTFVEFAAIDGAGNVSAWTPLSATGEANVSSSGTPVPLGIPGTWTLVFSDEFGAASLDTTKWQPGWFGSGITPPVNPSSEQACYDSNQVSVSGGTLNLSAIASRCTVNGTTYPDRSGMVTTLNSFTYTYGALEARIYLPGSAGTIDNWPAFWADGTGAWPTTGENDVVEGLGGLASYHFHSPAGGPGNSVAGDFTGWHTYAADWEPGLATYYYDGAPVGQITTGITSSPMFIILNYGISRTFGGPTSVPQTMKVDYVRVWQTPQ